jgi:large subunit ribosomal protein L13
MRTSNPKPQAPAFLLIDAAGNTIGKVATKAAVILRGKHKATFSPHRACGDHVIVINAAELRLPPKKGLRKTYYRHTGFAGNMKETTLQTMMRRDPRKVIELAVRGMLERNRLSRVLLKRLHVYTAAAHPYESHKPVTISLIRSMHV